MDNYPITNLYYGTINYQRIVDNYGSNCLTRSTVHVIAVNRIWIDQGWRY